MGTHLRVLSESNLMNTNMTEFRWPSKRLCFLVLWGKVASALEGLITTLSALKAQQFYITWSAVILDADWSVGARHEVVHMM